MQELLLYEYAVLRIVPRVDREEFVNTGVIVFCKSISFLACRIQVPEAKLHCLSEGLDIEEIKENLRAFEAIAQGKNCSNNIARLETASRFRWLTATRSTVIQCSKVHPGMTLSPEEELKQLFEKLVL